MWINYFKIAYRQLLKNKLSAFINILGLATGLAVVSLITLYIHHETSYDKWVRDSENIYRVYREWKSGGTHAITPTPLAEGINETFPEAVRAAKLLGEGEFLISVDNENFYLDGVAVVDSNFFQAIPLEFVQGDPSQALKAPGSAVITEAGAARIFGNTNPMGRSFKVNDEQMVQVTGILKDPAGLTHLDNQVYLNIDWGASAWTGAFGYTYVRFYPGLDKKVLEEKLTSFAHQNIIAEEAAEGTEVDESQLPKWLLQPFTDIHLQANNQISSQPDAGSLQKIGFLALMGLLILILASINYVNLSMALGFRRSKEVGVRKVTGATKGQMITQFLVEAVLQSLIALGFAVILAELFLSAFNQITYRNLAFLDLFQGWVPFAMIGISIGLGLVAGWYPSWKLSKVEAVSSLKGELIKGKQGSTFQSSLVIVQFTVSIVLAIVMAFMWKQMDYMINQELGFNDDQVLIMNLQSDEAIAQFPQKQEQLSKINGIKAVSKNRRMVGDFISNYTMRIADVDGRPSVNIFFTDAGLPQTLDLEILEGRFFESNRPTDTTSAFVVNETFIKHYQIENPIGHQLKFVRDEMYGSIVGVVKDFHYAGLDQNVQPLVLSSRQDLTSYNTIAMKIASSDIQQTIKEVESFYQSIEPAHPFRYDFLDEKFARQYDSYLQLGNTVFYVTLLSLLVALLGLFGLASFMAERRTKELGIRKVFGASVQAIVALLVKDYLRLVLIASLIAFPIGYYFIQNWLQNFAYRTAITVWPFLAILGIVGFLVLLIVGIKALRKATMNPVDTLRYE